VGVVGGVGGGWFVFFVFVFFFFLFVCRLVAVLLPSLAADARAKGKPLAVRSAYRSYALQKATFDSWVRRAGYEQALLFSARP
jgi:hypothetical protein